MNTENMLLVANLIEQNPRQFDMGWVDKVVPGTDTEGCIGGFCKNIIDHCPITAAEAIEIAFDLDFEKASSLCYGNRIWAKYSEELGIASFSGDYVDIDRITADHAVMMLRKLASGEWSFD